MSAVLFWLGLACVLLAMVFLFSSKLGLSSHLQRIGIRGEHGHRLVAMALAIAGFALFHFSHG